MSGLTRRPRSTRARLLAIAYSVWERNRIPGLYSPYRDSVLTAVIDRGALHILLEIYAAELSLLVIVTMGSTRSNHNDRNRSEKNDESWDITYMHLSSVWLTELSRIVDVSNKEMLSRYVYNTDCIQDRLLQGGTREQLDRNQTDRTGGIIHQIQKHSQTVGLSDDMLDRDTRKGSSK
jgi:hypothetical protein